jgi:hypothetical protein
VSGRFGRTRLWRVGAVRRAVETGCLLVIVAEPERLRAARGARERTHNQHGSEARSFHHAPESATPARSAPRRGATCAWALLEP